MANSAVLPLSARATKTHNTFNIEGKVTSVAKLISRERRASFGALLLVTYGSLDVGVSSDEQTNAVHIRVRPTQYAALKKDLVPGCRLRIHGHLALRHVVDDDMQQVAELHADEIEILGKTDCPAPVVPQREATLEDLLHTLRCVSQTAALLAGPQDANERFRNLESVASVCVFGKGHLFSAEQQKVYGEILTLMRHDGHPEGLPRVMTPAEQTKCAALWLSLLAKTAVRVGAAEKRAA